MGESVAFDRAAEFYDRTRAISTDAMVRTVEMLGAELRGRGRVLEVGVGTGLLAVPLHEAGVDVVGLDVSAPMVARLAEKAGGRPRFPVLLADATRMPFADGAFGAAFLRWVLHLVPNWQEALAEISRVVRAGGAFVASLGSYDGPREAIRRRFGEITGFSVEPVGLTWAGFDQLDAEMARHGATMRVLPEVSEEPTGTLGEFLDGIDEDLYSWTWQVPDEVRLRAGAELRGWAEERFGPLDRPDASAHATRWHAYHLPR